MTPLKYRGGIGRPTRNRRVPNYGTTTYAATGHGPYVSGLHDNLTTSEYQKLTGPRLAPRGEQSRAIKNMYTIIERPDALNWRVTCAWDAVSVKGVPFLPFHFNGMGHNPRYDLRPVRPKDMQLASNALMAFVRQHYLSRF